jgi:fatty acid desaturase
MVVPASRSGVRVFRYSEDRLPVALIVLLFAFDLAIYALVDAWQALLLWTVVGAIIKAHVCAWNHHHQHVATFEVAWMNRALEVVYGLQTGVVSHAWVLHHTLGHHVNYLDQERDESRWKRADGSTMGSLEYAAVVAVTAYGRALAVGRRFPKQRRIFIAMGVLTFSIVGALTVARPLPALLVFVVPMAISLFLTAWATHSHHADKPVGSHYVACNNILHRGYNVVTGNLGYHTAHHLRPGVHWSKLPALHARIADRIPADCYLTPGFPWRLRQTSLAPEVCAQRATLEHHDGCAPSGQT